MPPGARSNHVALGELFGMPTFCDVVIATRNRPTALGRCLAGLQRQSLPAFRVVVVDDASDEDLHPIVEDASTARMPTRYVRLDQLSGPAAARNAGVEASDAEFIVFVDDDVVPGERMLEAHLEAVSSGPAGQWIVSFGPFVQPDGWDPNPWNLWEARQARYESESMAAGLYEPTWRQFHTGNNCLPRKAFVNAGGFNPDFKRAEDDEFGLRLHHLGCKFVFLPGAIAWHYSERSLESWLAIPRAYARFDVLIDRLHPGEDYLRTKREELTERNAILRAIRSVTNATRMTALATRASVAAARVSYALGRKDTACHLLSIAYDLIYCCALDDFAASGSAEKRMPRTGFTSGDATDAH